ncbi:MAG TPA: hypothetical protein VGM40_05755 [Mycobacterium sp.]
MGRPAAPGGAALAIAAEFLGRRPAAPGGAALAIAAAAVLVGLSPTMGVA